MDATILSPSDRARIVNAFTEYDRKQKGKKGYNPYALSHYCRAIENVEEYLSEGYTLRQAIIKSYLGRLCDRILKELGLPQMTTDEAKWGIR